MMENAQSMVQSAAAGAMQMVRIARMEFAWNLIALPTPIYRKSALWAMVAKTIKALLAIKKAANTVASKAVLCARPDVKP